MIFLYFSFVFRFYVKLNLKVANYLVQQTKFKAAKHSDWGMGTVRCFSQVNVKNEVQISAKRCGKIAVLPEAKSV